MLMGNTEHRTLQTVNVLFFFYSRVERWNTWIRSRSTLQCNNQPVIDAFAIMKSLWLCLFQFLSKKCPPPPSSLALSAPLECINSVAINAQRIEYYRANSHGIPYINGNIESSFRFLLYSIAFAICSMHLFLFFFLCICFTATAQHRAIHSFSARSSKAAFEEENAENEADDEDGKKM